MHWHHGLKIITEHQNRITPGRRELIVAENSAALVEDLVCESAEPEKIGPNYLHMYPLTSTDY